MLRKFFTHTLFPALALLIVLGFVTASPSLAQGNQVGIGPFCAGDNITIGAGQTTQGILGFGCNITIQQGATVNGDIADFGGNLAIEGTVNGDIVTFGGNVSLGETAVVAGDIRSMGGNVQRAPGAVVQGGVSGAGGNFPPVSPIAPLQPIPPTPMNPFSRAFNFGFDILGGIVTAFAFAALGALVVIFAPNATKRVSDAAQTKPLNTAGVGCLTLIVLPVLALLLIITIIGIPIAFILGLLAAAAWIFGAIGIGLLAGEKILQALKARDILPVVAVMLGVVVLMLIGQVPIIGWLISLAVGLIGLGAVVLTRFGTRAYPTPPGMMMTPVMAAAPSVPGTYTPSAVDVAAWEAKARQAEARETPPAASSAMTSADVSPTETQMDIPSASDMKKTDADETPPPHASETDKPNTDETDKPNP